MGFQFTRYCFTRSRIFRLSTFFLSPCWLHLQNRLWALDCGKMTNEFCTYSSTSVISSWTKNSTDSSSNSSALLSSSSVSIPTAKWNKKTPQDLITDAKILTRVLARLRGPSRAGSGLQECRKGRLDFCRHLRSQFHSFLHKMRSTVKGRGDTLWCLLALVFAFPFSTR